MGRLGACMHFLPFRDDRFCCTVHRTYNHAASEFNFFLCKIKSRKNEKTALIECSMHFLLQC